MDTQIYYVFQNYLTNNPFSQEMSSRWPLSRDSQFKRHFFTRGGGETEDRAKISTSPLFEGLLINDPSKRADMETWARSSVSLSSQVKMKLKSTTST